MPISPPFSPRHSQDGRLTKYMMGWTVGMPMETHLSITAMCLSGAFVSPPSPPLPDVGVVAVRERLVGAIARDRPV